MRQWSIIRTGALGLMVFWLPGQGLRAAGARDDKPASPQERLEALKRESDQIYGRIEARRSQAKDDATKKAAVDQYWKDKQALAARAFALADEHPDDPAALDAIIWVINNLTAGTFPGNSELTNKAFDLLAKRWITSEKLAPTCYYGSLQSVASPQALHFLQAASEKSPYRLVRGTACIALAQHYRDTARLARRMRDRISRSLLKERWAAEPGFLEVLEKTDCEQCEREAEALFDRVIAEFADVRMPYPYNETPLGKLARGELFRLRNLSIGKAAPELEGEDMDGRKLRLSDYRGKVVALVFWATWCGPCMGMVPHERELVKRLEGKPFVLLGINGDDDREAAKAVMTRERMTWRSWWNGGKTGEIVTRWGVTSWPTVYILDAKGVIRYENVRFEAMDQAIDRLVKEAKAGDQ
jgi:thiol-disulfide isomerase/thioredoxin